MSLHEKQLFWLEGYQGIDQGYEQYFWGGISDENASLTALRQKRQWVWTFDG